MGTFNHNDTLSTTTSISVPNLQFGTDYVLKSQGDSEVVYQYTKSDADQPESIRFANADVQNVYGGTEIQPALFSVSKKGRRVLVSILGTYRVTNADGSIIDYPVKAGVTLQFPISASVDADAVTEELKRGISCLFAGADTSAEVNKLMRGIILQ